MKKPNIDQKIIASIPADIGGDDKFVAHTMHAVGESRASETFARVLRIANATKKETLTMKLGKLYAKLKQLPAYVLVLIILGTTATVGAAAYAAYRWIIPEVTITNIQQNNDDNKKQYTVDSQCGDFNSGKSLQYEVSRSSGLTDDDVYKVFKNTCAYDALGTFIDSHWISDNSSEEFSKKKVGDIVTIYDRHNTFAGSEESNPIFGLTIGTVSEISAAKVSFSLPIYGVDNSAGMKPADYYPDGKAFSRTLSLAPEVEVWSDGKKLSLAGIKPGDQIQVVTRTQNKVQYYDDIKQNALGEQITFDVVGIIKTNIDTKYVANGGAQIGDPKIVNAIASLSPCPGNDQYLCVSVPNQILGPVYSVSDDISQDNMKYLRKDIVDNKKINYYRLDGRITKIDGTRVTLETRGTKTAFTVDFPYDAITPYNQPKPVATDSDRSKALKVEVGDLVQVNYGQFAAENHLAIKPSDLQGFSVLEQILPDGSLAKY